jgi:hypothetical protein
MGAAALKRQVAELVDDEQLWLARKQQPVGELTFRFHFAEGREQRSRS